MSLHDLPRETIDHIIRLLADDYRTLSACSLVGWKLLPSCRHIMFSTVSVEYGKLGALLDVIDNPLSTVTPALRGLRFKQKPECLRHVDGGEPVPFVTRGVMKMLQSIRYVQLEGIPPRGVVGFWKFMDELKGVRDVEIESGVFEISDVVVGWVCGLPELQELSVARLSSLAKAAPLEWHMPVPSWTAIEAKARNSGGMRISLDIGDWDQFGVVRWLMLQSPVPCVRTLKIGSNRKGFWDGGSPGDLHFLKKFVESAGSSIENLRILLPGDGDTDVLESLDLSPCTNLRSIHIDGFQIGPANRIQRTALEVLLEKVAECADGQYLQNITLAIQVDPHVRHMLAFFGISEVVLFKKFDWGRIPELLTKGREWSRSSSGDQGKQLALVVQKCSKYQHEGIEQVLRQGIFHDLERRASLSVRFDGGEASQQQPW